MDATADPTFESLRRQCSADNGYTTSVELPLGTISCRFKARRKSARMDFDLGATAFNIVLDRWREVIKRHEAYVKEHFARNDWKDMAGRFSPDAFCLDVLREDAEEWFALLHGRLLRQEGMTGVSPMTRKRGW